MTTRRQFLATTAAALAAPALSRSAFAQAWPSRPIRAMVPFAAGSSLDIVGRLVLDPLATPARPADRGREPRRRRRHDRHRSGRQGRSGRLQHPDPGVGAFGRARGLSEHHLRRRQGFRRHHPVRHAAERHGRRARQRHQDAEGPRRQGQGRLDHLRLRRRRQRHALGGRAHPRRRRLPGRARAVPRRPRGADRGDDRPRRLHLAWACRRRCR